MKKIVYILLAHLAYLALFFPLAIIILPGTTGGFMLIAFAGVNVFCAFLQWILRVREMNPVSPLSLLIHNGVIFTRRLLTVASIAWITFFILTVGFISFIYSFLIFSLFLVWYIGGIIVLIHTARTKNIYTSSKDSTIPQPQVTGIFWPYILFFVALGIAFLLSMSSVRQMISLSYQFYIKGEIPVAIVADYINENTNCDSYDKNTNSYATCKIGQYTTEGIYKSGLLDCSNMYVYDKDCLHLQVVQSAIAKQDSNLCNSLKDTNQFPICIGQFPQSSVWQSGCAAIMSKVLNESRNLESQIIAGRCLTQANADLTVPRSDFGRLSNSWSKYEVPYKENYIKLKRTTDIYSPQAPVWFTNWGEIDKKTTDYLKSIHADPNNTDDFGRTALVLFINHLSYLVDSTVSQLPERQQPQVIEKELEPLKILIDFGVDPSKRDLIGKNSFDHAQEIDNELLRKRVIEIMQ